MAYQTLPCPRPREANQTLVLTGGGPATLHGEVPNLPYAIGGAMQGISRKQSQLTTAGKCPVTVATLSGGRSQPYPYEDALIRPPVPTVITTQSIISILALHEKLVLIIVVFVQQVGNKVDIEDQKHRHPIERAAYGHHLVPLARHY